MKLNPNSSNNSAGYWAQLVKDAPDHTDKKKTKGRA